MAMKYVPPQAQGQGQEGQAQPGARADMAPLLQQLNIASIRTRLQDLQSTLSRIVHSFHTNPSPKWSEVLGQFAIINVELLNLVEDIKPTLKYFVAHPKNVNAENASILPIMLSSKLLPEMEAEESTLKEKHFSGLANLPVSMQTEFLQKQIEMVRAACDVAEKVLADTRKVYGLGTRQGPVLFPTIEKAQAAKIMEQEKLLRAAANFGEGLRISPDHRHVSGSLPQHLTSSFTMGDSASSTFQITDSGLGLPKTPTSVAPTTSFARSGGTQQVVLPQVGSIPSPLQTLGGASASGTPSAVMFTNSPRSGNFNASSPQHQSQQQQNQASLLQRQKLQQMQKQQQLQQLRQPTTPPLPHAQILNHQPAAGQQPILQPQQAKLQQLQQSSIQQLQQQQQAQLQQHIQAHQERQLQLQIQQQQQQHQQQQMQNTQLQPLQQSLGQNHSLPVNAVRPQLGQLSQGTGNSLFGATQSSILTSNMIANLTQSGHSQALLQQRLQFGAGGSSGQSQRNLSSQMLADSAYMGLSGGTQVSAGLGLPLQQLGGQSNYSTLIKSQTNILNTNQSNLLNSNQTNLLNTGQNTLLDPSQSSLLNANQSSLLNVNQNSLLGSSENTLLNANQNTLMNSAQNSLLNAGQNLVFGQRQQPPP